MPSSLLDPTALNRLANLQLRARAVVEGFLTGLHQSPYHGFSVEFAQHRPYMPGDSLRHLDYKVLGRTGRYYIKQFEEETNLKAYLLVDHSGSMGFGSGDGAPSKLNYGSCVAAALALLLLKQRDAVGLVSFGETVDAILPPRSAQGYLEPLAVHLEHLRPTGATNVAGALFQIAERVKRRGLVVLISDLLSDPGPTLAAMKAIRHVGHELIVFQILHPREMDFGFPRDARFKDLESGDLLPTRPWHIREAYRHEMEQFLSRYREECRAARIDYHLFTTETPYDVALFEFLARRRRMH
ncbi:MAG: DUF58 domain-containing protein [Calditrichaeota bacterium]|nr:DUF58 domain-containing protein [Calditrichota bacterium]